MSSGIRQQIRDIAMPYLTWCILRVFDIECSYTEVKNGRYDVDPAVPDLTPANDASGLLDLAKLEYDESSQRRDSVMDKCKSLLMISAILLPILSLTATQTVLPWLFIVPGLFVLATAFLLLNVLGIGSDMQIQLEPSYVQLNEKELQTQLARDYLVCARRNSGRTDYLVDSLRAARSSLVLGLLSLVIVSSSGFIFYRKVEPAQILGTKERTAAHPPESGQSEAEAPPPRAAERVPAAEQSERRPTVDESPAAERIPAPGDRPLEEEGRPADQPPPSDKAPVEQSP